MTDAITAANTLHALIDTKLGRPVAGRCGICGIESVLHEGERGDEHCWTVHDEKLAKAE